MRVNRPSRCRAIAVVAVAMTVLVASGTATVAARSTESSEGGIVRLLEFYTQSNNTENLEWLDMVTAIFEEENPGWNVEYESATFDQIDQKAIIDFEAGVAHDVVLTSPQLMAKHEAAGDLLDLTPYIEESYTSEQIEDLNWSAGWASATFGDQQIGVATGIHIRGNIVNNEIFEAAGLDPSVPLTTPDEVLEAAIAIQESGAAEWGLGAFLGSNRATVEVTYAPLVWGYGGDFWEDDAPAITSEASVRAVEWLWDAVNEHEIIPPFAAAADADYDAMAKDAFLDGIVGQATGFGSYWIAAVEEAGFTEGCFPATAECVADGVTPMVSPNPGGAGFANAWDLSIHANSENPEMAWKLIETMMRPENITQYPDAGLPPWLSIYDSEAYSSDYWQIWREAAELGRGVPQTPFFTELADAIYVAIQEAIAADREEIPRILEDAQNEFVAAYLN
jgi:ABC-type glycerol-3-phosphate transport system substrate-binding protein